jgi:hypothetical protein
VRGEVDDVVGGSGALVGAGAERGGPYDVPPDTSVMTPSMVGKIAGSGPIGVQGDDTDSQHEISTLSTLSRAAPASSPGSTMIAPRRRVRGTSAAVMLLSFVLGSLGMVGAFVMWGDAIQATLVEPSEGRGEAESLKLEAKPLPPAPRPDGKSSPNPPGPEPLGSTSDGATGGTSEDDDGSTSGTGGSDESTEESSSTGASGLPPEEGGKPVLPQKPVRPKRPMTYLTVAVDSGVPLVVRVGRKTMTIESQRSKPFLVPVGKGLKVQWKREGGIAWIEHRVDIPPKCEMQLRIPSRKTMFIGTCG